MILKFIGDWRKLIPLGYKFQRLYARNYICYSKGQIDNRIWIWKKGKDIELSGVNNKDTCLIMKYLIDNNFKSPDNYDMLVINRETSSIEEFDFDKHDIMFVYEREQLKKLTKEDRQNFYDKFKKVLINEDIIKILKELYDNNLIEMSN